LVYKVTVNGNRITNELTLSVRCAKEKKMTKEKILPTLLIIIDVAAALFYIPSGNARMVIYWFAAATLTAVVTW
jgi:hypothetical protein